MDVRQTHPAAEHIRSLGYSVSGLAQRYGIRRDLLANVLKGRVVPPHEVRVALTDATDLPITELFDAETLMRSYRPHRTQREDT